MIKNNLPFLTVCAICRILYCYEEPRIYLYAFGKNISHEAEALFELRYNICDKNMLKC